MVNVELPCYILIKIKWCDAKEKKKHHERITKYAELMCTCLRNRMQKMEEGEREREREERRDMDVEVWDWSKDWSWFHFQCRILLSSVSRPLYAGYYTGMFCALDVLWSNTEHYSE